MTLFACSPTRGLCNSLYGSWRRDTTPNINQNPIILKLIGPGGRALSLRAPPYETSILSKRISDSHSGILATPHANNLYENIYQ